MSQIELRDYQRKAVDSVFREWSEGRKRTLLVLPTGTGKTIIFSQIAKRCVAEGERVLILAHRGELLEQAADKLRKSTGLGCSVEKAEQTCIGSWYRVTVGSIQSFMQDSRLGRFAPDYFDTIIVDEAHHVMADGYQKVLGYFDQAKVLGCTATIDRMDMKDLGDYFQSLAFEYTLPEAIRSGYLCKIKAQTIPLKIDISGVEIQNGDFAAGQIASSIDPYLEQIADEMAKLCMDRHTVVFLPLVQTSRRMAQVLNERGFRAAEVNGESKDRKQILQDFATRKYNVICNSMLLTEGWDCPEVDCVIVLRPTKARAVYVQAVGRGLRLAQGKDHCLLLDFLWLTDRLELCRPSALIASDSEEKQAMDQVTAKATSGPVDLENAQEEAQEIAMNIREAALAKALEQMRKRKRKLVDPLQYEMSIKANPDYIPSFGWEMEKPTDDQKKELGKLGIFADEIKTRGKAQQLLESVTSRKAMGLATPKQIRFLEGRGFLHVGTWTQADAQKMIGRISMNHWMIPAGVIPATYKPGGTYGHH